jgi:hypothetical protein
MSWENNFCNAGKSAADENIQSIQRYYMSTQEKANPPRNRNQVTETTGTEATTETGKCCAMAIEI